MISIQQTFLTLKNVIDSNNISIRHFSKLPARIGFQNKSNKLKNLVYYT